MDDLRRSWSSPAGGDRGCGAVVPGGWTLAILTLAILLVLDFLLFCPESGLAEESADTGHVSAEAPAEVEAPVLAAPQPESGTDPQQLRLSVLTPQDRAFVADDRDDLLVAGRALSVSARAEIFDLVVVLDTSRSTAAPAGADVDGDGWVGSGRGGRWIEAQSDDRGDSVLAAQIFATRALLAQLDPRTTRVGLVTFSGDSRPETPDAVRLAPLTGDFLLLHRALDYLLGQRPTGKTNIAEAIDTAASELIGLGRSRSRAGATRVILLMTDGQPTLPFSDTERNAEYTIEVAQRAADRGVRIDTFPIGALANRDIYVTGKLAALSGGRFTPVLQPADLLATFENVHLTGLVALEIRNRTTGDRANPVIVEGDGYFSALLPVADGENLVEIRALDGDGRRSVRRLHVLRVAGGPVRVLSPRLARRQTRLLRGRLLELYRDHVEHERARWEARRARSVDVRVPSEDAGQE